MKLKRIKDQDEVEFSMNVFKHTKDQIVTLTLTEDKIEEHMNYVFPVVIEAEASAKATFPTLPT